MPPSDPIVLAANGALADPQVREAVREMHRADTPLLQMVDALGLDDDMSARIRDIVAGLSPDVVTGIRDATVALLDGGGAVLPVDCSVSPAQLDGGTPVTVDVTDEGGTATIRVRPTASP
jgi:hypothetical protein